MARLASKQLGGYYKTPTHLLPNIGALINHASLRSALPTASSSLYKYFHIADPCAGTGEALIGLSQSIIEGSNKCVPAPVSLKLFACELEKERSKQLEDVLERVKWANHHDARVLHGDAFGINRKNLDGIQVLYLNPPYDDDQTYGRLEHRFLTRFTESLVGGGILFFVVPHASLVTSAEFLSMNYERITCWKFPPADYAAFKQCVLVAVKRGGEVRLMQSDQTAVASMRQWARGENFTGCLSQPTQVVNMPPPISYGPSWNIEAFDVESVARAYCPWHHGNSDKLKHLSGMGDTQRLQDVVGREFPMLLPPRPVHVATAIASGLVNGRTLEPDDPNSGKSHIMIKGVFEKDFKTQEEKTNKDGEVTSVTLVQQPKLCVTVLDMKKWTYHELKTGSTPTGKDSFSEMNIADLLVYYGRGLARLMNEQCPPLHNPANPTELLALPPMGLKPFTMQAHVVSATLKAMHTDRSFVPLISGEVGTGKSSMSLLIAESLSKTYREDIASQIEGMMGAAVHRLPTVGRVLILCPPHLLKNWRDEIAKFLPGATAIVLDSVEAINRPYQPTRDGRPGCELVIYILSRETAKLGHGWEAATQKINGRRVCPRCGDAIPVGLSNEIIVRKRLRCSTKRTKPTNKWAKVAQTGLADLLKISTTTFVRDALRIFYDGSHYALEMIESLEKRVSDPSLSFEKRLPFLTEKWNKSQNDQPLLESPLGRLLTVIADSVIENIEDYSLTHLDLLKLGLMIGSENGRDAFILDVLERCQKSIKPTLFGRVAGAIAELILFLDKRESYDQAMQIMNWNLPYNESLKPKIKHAYNCISNGSYLPDSKTSHIDVGVVDDQKVWEYGARMLAFGSLEAIEQFVVSLKKLCKFEMGKECGEPLYQATPSPRRVQLGKYICKHRPDLFDLLIVDEAHEYRTDGSAQQITSHRLSGLGKLELRLTGTTNDGYASSFFVNMWYGSQKFRREFGRNDVQEFVTRYGYRKVLVQGDDAIDYALMDHGTSSDRITTLAKMKMRDIGESPGVHPLFIFTHLLGVSVHIQKSDLDNELPPFPKITVPVEPSEELLEQYLHLQEALFAQIGEDLRDEELAGKLWGQVATLPTYLDRATSDTGNTEDEATNTHWYEIRYPASVGGELVCAAKPITEDVVLPKEEKMLEIIERELAEGRKVLLFVWNTTRLPDRYQRLIIDRFGDIAVILDSAKVPTATRQDWIDRKVVKAGKKVLITNPKCVETGLNNLTYFPTALWMQNPNCSSVMWTQANGRIHRPGQKANEVRAYVLYYGNTVQEPQFNLFSAKVLASLQADGLDIESALRAAGADDTDVINTMSIGKALFNMIRNDSVFNRQRGIFHQMETRQIVHRPKPLATLFVDNDKVKGEQMRLLEAHNLYKIRIDNSQ